MQPISIAVVAGGRIIGDWSPYATSAQWDYAEHGVRSLTLRVPRRAVEIFAIYGSRIVPSVVAARGGRVLWAGRIDASTLRLTAAGSEIEVHALGNWQALRDGRHTALWSTTRYDTWRPVTPQDVASRDDTAWITDTNSRLFIGLKKGITYPNNTRIGSLVLELPDGGSRGAIGAQFTIAYGLPAGFNFGVVTTDAAWGGGVVLFSLTPGATSNTRSYHLTFASAQKIELFLRNLSGAPVTNAAEDGELHIRVTNLRVVSDTTNRINTALTANVVGGSNVTLPVGSTAGMYVGQQLVIDSGNVDSQIATVVSITDATHVVIDSLTWNKLSGLAVQGHRVLASTIAPAIVAEAAALNSGALSDDLAQIASTAMDLTDTVYEDALPADVLDDLAARGDGLGGQIETGVDELRRPYFRPKGSLAQRWYAQLEALSVERPISAVENRVYATYDDVAGVRTRRTAAANDTTSQGDYGLIRVGAVAAKTSNATLAGVVRDLALSDRSDPAPGAEIAVRQLENATGGIVPGDQVRPGDTITIRNLPPTLSGATLDRIRTFVVSEATYDGMTGRVSVVPETPLPELDVLVAQGLIPS